MLLPILMVILVAIFLLALWVNNGNLTAPSVIFAAGFVFCAAWALAYAAKWSYTMRPEAFVAIGGGVALFLIACAATRQLVFRGQDWSAPIGIWDGKAPIWCMALFLVLQAIVCVWFAVRVKQMFPRESIAASIAAYKYAGTFTTESTYLGFPLNPLRVVCRAAAYVAGYMFVCALVSHDEPLPMALLALSVLMNFVLNWEGGGRSGIAVYAVYIAVLGLLVLREHRQGSFVLSGKLILFIAVASALFIAAFRLLGIGRHGGFSIIKTLNNLSAYCGAEIPNLDYWMRTSRNRANDIWGSMTFIRTINYLGPKLGIDEWTYPLDLPFVYSNWHWLGNVYTTFYAFLYDFGWTGLVVLTLIMGAVSEAVFCTSGRATKFRDLWMMVYSYLAPQLLLSFFSNKFYENFLAVGFLRVLLVIVVVRVVLVFFNSLSIRGIQPKHLNASLDVER